MRIHLDTDLGGDTDDACALVMLLGWPCAVAVGWPAASVEVMRLRPAKRDGVLSFQPHRQGRPTRVVTDVDGAAFQEMWLSTVEAAGAAAS